MAPKIKLPIRASTIIRENIVGRGIAAYRFAAFYNHVDLENAERFKSSAARVNAILELLPRGILIPKPTGLRSAFCDDECIGIASYKALERVTSLFKILVHRDFGAQTNIESIIDAEVFRIRKDQSRRGLAVLEVKLIVADAFGTLRT